MKKPKKHVIKRSVSIKRGFDTLKGRRLLQSSVRQARARGGQDILKGFYEKVGLVEKRKDSEKCRIPVSYSYESDGLIHRPKLSAKVTLRKKSNVLKGEPTFDFFKEVIRRFPAFEGRRVVDLEIVHSDKVTHKGLITGRDKYSAYRESARLAVEVDGELRGFEVDFDNRGRPKYVRQINAEKDDSNIIR